MKRLLEKRVGKPVDGPPAPHSMQLQEAQAGLSWLSEHFTLLSRERNLELTSLESVLELARIATLRHAAIKPHDFPRRRSSPCAW